MKKEQILEEIKKAVTALEWIGEVDCKEVSSGRVMVFVDDVTVGIYDFERHTFVD